jgi:hypothetical protein
MGLVKGGKRGFSVLALMMGVCLTPSCVSTAPSAGEDWRTLRRIDLPAQLVRATWSEGSYLSEGHPMQFGRLEITMDSGGVARRSIVRTPKSANHGLLIDNLTCYNEVRGARPCALLLNQPNYCHLFVYAESGTSDNEDFDVVCPAYLTLGR